MRYRREWLSLKGATTGRDASRFRQFCQLVPKRSLPKHPHYPRNPLPNPSSAYIAGFAYGFWRHRLRFKIGVSAAVARVPWASSADYAGFAYRNRQGKLMSVSLRARGGVLRENPTRQMIKSPHPMCNFYRSRLTAESQVFGSFFVARIVLPPPLGKHVARFTEDTGGGSVLGHPACVG